MQRKMNEWLSSSNRQMKHALVLLLLKASFQQPNSAWFKRQQESRSLKQPCSVLLLPLLCLFSIGYCLWCRLQLSVRGLQLGSTQVSPVR